MSPSRISDQAEIAVHPHKAAGIIDTLPGTPSSSTASKKFGSSMNTSMVESKFLTHPDELGVVAVGFSGGQVRPPYSCLGWLIAGAEAYLPKSSANPESTLRPRR